MTIKITSQQCRAARALLGISQNEAASGMGISEIGLRKFESGEPIDTRISTYEKIFRFFNNRNICFTKNGGVEPRLHQDIRKLHGIDGFRNFMDDVYETAKAGGSLFLFNTQPQLWIKYLGKEWYDMHNKRMSALGSLDVRIITAKGNKNFILDSAAYRWFPKGRFYDAMFYCYGDKISLLNFENDDIEITIIDMKNFANGFRELFKSTWKYDSIHARDPLI